MMNYIISFSPLDITIATAALCPLQFQAERTNCNNAEDVFTITVVLVVLKSSTTDAFSSDKPSRT
jgi:hypothetical protein